MLTKTTNRSELFVVYRNTLPESAFEETHEGRQLWNKHVRLARIVEHLDDTGRLDSVQVMTSVYALCLNPKVKQVWLRSDDRGNMLCRVDRPAFGKVPVSRFEKYAALARGEISKADM